jgi:hypothetical protein
LSQEREKTWRGHCWAYTIGHFRNLARKKEAMKRSTADAARLISGADQGMVSRIDQYASFVHEIAVDLEMDFPREGEKCGRHL